MAGRTQVINYGNAIVLPVAAGAAYTPVPPAEPGAAVPTKAANELFPTRPYNRIGAWVKNLSAANTLNIIGPSGSIFVMDPSSVINMASGFFMEDGAYTVTGTAGQTFSFWEAY